VQSNLLDQSRYLRLSSA